jgi:hypothetical protein
MTPDQLANLRREAVDALANHPNDPDLNVVAVPCADLLGLLDERDRLAARVLELEAPGECQSMHKLRAERDQARELAKTLLDERDELAAEVAALTHGTGEGAVNEHWKCTSWGNFTRTLPNGAELRAGASGWATYSPDGLLKDHHDITIEKATQRLPRVNMRAAEAAARSRGWLS